MSLSNVIENFKDDLFETYESDGERMDEDKFSDFVHEQLDHFVSYEFHQSEIQDSIREFGIGRSINLVVDAYGIESLNTDDSYLLERQLMYYIIMDALDLNDLYTNFQDRDKCICDE